MKPIIKEPCNKKWNELHPNQKGAFCNSCSKTVIDFTQKSNEEILDYLKQNFEKNVCGRMLVPKPKPWYQWKYIATLIAPFLWACNGFSQNGGKIGEIKVQNAHPVDTTKSSDTLKCQPKMGKMVVPHSVPMIDTPTAKKPEHVEILGDVAIEMGEVMVEEPKEIPKPKEIIKEDEDDIE